MADQVFGGGSILQEVTSTKAWGVNPASASVKLVSGETPFSLDQEVVLVMAAPSGGLMTLSGIIQAVTQLSRAEGGSVWQVDVVDRRLRLQGATVYGAWNMDNPEFRDVSVKGPSNARYRYYSVLPADWESGLRTYHNEPSTATQILQQAFAGAVGTVSLGVAVGGAAELSAPWLGIDCMRGRKLGALVGAATQHFGIDCYLSGASTLTFGNKSAGTYSVAVTATETLIESGVSLAPLDTQIRVVGDQNLVQTQVDLEPDWQPGWEPFAVSEILWQEEVGRVFDLTAKTREAYADRALKANTVTVREFVAASEKGDLADHGSWGDASRMDLPAIVYLTKIVYRAYRIPRNYRLFGVTPLSSLRLHPGLLVGMQHSGGTLSYAPGEYYPRAKAFVIATGQPIDAIDPVTGQVNAAFSSIDALSREYSSVGGFDLDPNNYAFIFDTPMIVPGEGEDGLFIFPNAGLVEGGEKDWNEVVVPNPDFVVTPAQAKAAVVFEVGQFHLQVGSGKRHGSRYQSGLAMHLLDTRFGGEVAGAVAPGSAVPAGYTVQELSYEGGRTAGSIAEEIGLAARATDQTNTKGRVERPGVIGTAVQEGVDRVTTRMTPRGGVSETIDLVTPAQPRGGVLSEKALERQQQADELYSGERQHERDVKQLKGLIALTKPASTGSGRKKTTYGELMDVPKRAVRNPDGNTQFLPAFNDEDWKAGDVIFGGENGKPDPAGSAFLGVAVADKKGDGVHIVTTGLVPVRLKGQLEPGATIGVDDGETVGRVGGRRPIGRLEMGSALDAGEEQPVLGYVHLGPVTSSEEDYPFKVLVTTNTEDAVWEIRLREGFISAVRSVADYDFYPLFIDRRLNDEGGGTFQIPFAGEDRDYFLHHKQVVEPIVLGPDGGKWIFGGRSRSCEVVAGEEAFIPNIEVQVDGGGGVPVDGEYYRLLARIEIRDGSLSVVPFTQSNLECDMAGDSFHLYRS